MSARMSAPAGLEAAAESALAFVRDGARVGLGTGRAAAAFIARLGGAGAGGAGGHLRRHVGGVGARWRGRRGCGSVELDEEHLLDVTVDGADEVAPNLNLIKGRGGAFVRERIVAAASRRQVILVGPEKLVGALGETGPLPVEVIPMALGPCMRRLKELGRAAGPAARRRRRGSRSSATTATWSSTWRWRATLLDAAAARALDAELRAIPGVVDTGLFIATAERVLVGQPDGDVDTRWPQH